MKFWSMLLILGFSTLFLAGCSLFNKNTDDTLIQTGSMELSGIVEETGALDVIVDQTGTVVVTGETENTVEEQTSIDNTGDTSSLDESGDLQETIKELIDKRKETLGDSDNLTEDDIQLIEDILDELVKSVK